MEKLHFHYNVVKPMYVAIFVVLLVPTVVQKCYRELYMHVILVKGFYSLTSSSLTLLTKLLHRSNDFALVTSDDYMHVKVQY